MHNLISFILILAVAAAASAQDIKNIDDYLKENIVKYDNTIKDMDSDMYMFNQATNAGLKTINFKLNLLIPTISQTQQKFNQSEVLNDLNKECIKKYGKKIPSISNTISEINTCVLKATNTTANLLDDPLVTRNTLESYYQYNFSKTIDECQKFTNSVYIMCVMNAVQDADIFTFSSTITFYTQMARSNKFRNAYIEESLACSFRTEENVMLSIAEITTLNDKCMSGGDNCLKCGLLYTCSEVTSYKGESNIYNIKEIDNAFYHNYNATNCMMLRIIN